MKKQLFSLLLIPASAVYAVRVGAPQLSRQLASSLTLRGNDGSPASAFPLGLCEGDCDRDSDCQPGLKCFQRNQREAVPGCSGSGWTGVDYCYNASFSSGGSIPGNTTSPPVLNLTGDNGQPRFAFPLAKCQGDCEDDSDCQPGLQCFSREQLQSIPGCSGSGQVKKDYCYNPADDTDSNISANFRLKMYWQQGYYWQEETFERKWCADCSEIGQNCTIHNCGGSSSRFEFVPQSLGYQIKIAGTNNCLQLMRYSFVQPQTCSNSSRLQQWTGTFTESRFELTPVSNTDLCITSPHHPRYGETLSCYRCAIVRTYQTSYWNKH